MLILQQLQIKTMSAEKCTIKRAHRSLSIKDKLQILDQIGKKSYKVLSEEYGVGISDIKKKGSEFREYKRKMTEMGCKRPVKIMKMGRDQELEMAVFLWFKQKREEGIPITGIVLAIHAVQARV